jgi:hypothetical protein
MRGKIFIFRVLGVARGGGASAGALGWRAALGLGKWKQIEIHYSPSKRPVIITNTGTGELLSEEIIEIRDKLIGHHSPNVDFAQRHLNRTKRIVALEIDRERLSDDAWEMLDGLQA